MEPAIAAAAKTLRAGGCLAFNIGRQFLMLPLTDQDLRPATPSLHHLIQAVAVLDHGFAPPHPALSRGRLPSPALVADMIDRAGLALDHTEMFEYDNTPEAQLAWLSVPIFAENVLPGMPYDQQLQVIEKAFARFGKAPSRSAWMAFVARKPP